MDFNFVSCDRGQSFLLPPDMREWLPADHLAWFVIDVVTQLELEDFRRHEARSVGRSDVHTGHRELRVGIGRTSRRDAVTC